MKTIETNRTGLPRTASMLFLTALAVAAFTTSALAVGIRFPHEDADAIARGDAFAATADNPSAIYYNPAGISQLKGDQFRAGMYFISADTEYTGPGGAKGQTDTYFQPVPQLFYTHEIKNTPLTLGMGVYTPFGLSLDWGDNNPFPFSAQSGKVLMATFNPVIAWQVHPTLSIAVGPTINYADAKLTTAAFHFKGDDTAPGFNAGILWQPHQMWSFGVNYHSATDLKLEGQSTLNFPALGESPTSGRVHIPQYAVMGVSFRPTTNWNFEFDLDWTDWDTFQQINFTRADTAVVPFAFNYKSSFIYDFGVTRQFGHGWYGSVGYIYNENSIPDTTFNPIVPDMDMHIGSIGVGHRGKKFDWAAGYHFAYGTRDVSTSIYPGANGHYEVLNHAFNLSLTWHF